MTFGDKLSKLRKENNLTQEQLADMLGVSRQSVSKWESNSAYPETDKLISLANLFKCSIDYLLKDECLTCSEYNNKYQNIKPNIISNHQKIVGYILLAVSLICGILTLLFAKDEESLILALIMSATLLSCSLICLFVKQKAGYWCAWAGFAPFVILSPQIVSMKFLAGIDITVICFYVIMFFVARKIFDANIVTNSKRNTLIIIAWVLLATVKLSIHIVPIILANFSFVFLISPLFYIQIDFIFYVIMAFLMTYTVRYLKSLKRS